MRRTPILLLVLAALVLAAAPADAASRDFHGAKETVAVMKTTQGEIVLRFFPGKAPEHVKNFLAHAKSGYYTKTYFHRVFPGFMIQGGDPNTKDADPGNDGAGGHSYKGPGKMLKAEFNDTPHVRGVLSMARTASPDSAGSQFFIMVAAATHLDGQYSAFGRVIRGMDVVDKIVAQPGTPIPGAGGVNPTEHQFLEAIAIEEWPADEVYLAEAKQYGASACLRQPLAILETTHGDIAVAFLGDKAPAHVRNFLHHCRSGLYERTAFHDLVPKEAVRGGDPNTKNDDPADDGKGGHSYEGAGKFLKAEFNDAKVVRGALTMDLGEDDDSAGSRFTVHLADAPNLDGARTVFGRVVAGLEAADAMAELGALEGKPDKAPAIKKARVEYKTPKEVAEAANAADRAKALEALKAPRGKQFVAILETTSGTIVLKFFPDKAPVHVHNFIEHCRSGFYEGSYFHRVVPGFMIQGGDPNTKDDDPDNDGKGGHSFKGEKTALKAEFNDVKHVRGILSMARTDDPDSAGSQFFIMVADNPSLDGKYSAFGAVVSGMPAVDKIVNQPVAQGSTNPLERQIIKKATVELWTSAKVASEERKKN